MTRISLVVLCTAVALGTAGCGIVKDTPEDERAIAADASGDDARSELRLAETFDTQLVPYITDNGLSLDALAGALAGGLDEAGAADGTRGSGQGAAWNSR